MMRSAILVYGNCQSNAISACLRRLPAVTEAYDIVNIPSFIHPIDGPTPIWPEDLARCAALIEQRSLWDRFPALGDLPAGVALIDYPMLALNAIWPLQAKEPRNKPEPKFPFGRYPYGDRLLNRLLAENRGEVLDRYLTTPLVTLLDPIRFCALEEQRIAALDRKCGLAFGGWMLERFRKQRLFWTYNHPTALLLRPLAEAIVERLAKALGLPTAIVEDIAPLFAEGWEPADWLKVAIHPDAAAALDLQWYDESLLYAHYQHRDVSYADYWWHQIDFD